MQTRLDAPMICAYGHAYQVARVWQWPPWPTKCRMVLSKAKVPQGPFTKYRRAPSPKPPHQVPHGLVQSPYGPDVAGLQVLRQVTAHVALDDQLGRRDLQQGGARKQSGSKRARVGGRPSLLLSHHATQTAAWLVLRSPATRLKPPPRLQSPWRLRPRGQGGGKSPRWLPPKKAPQGRSLDFCRSPAEPLAEPPPKPHKVASCPKLCRCSGMGPGAEPEGSGPAWQLSPLPPSLGFSVLLLPFPRMRLPVCGLSPTFGGRNCRPIPGP